MLTQDEELWEKTLPPAVEELLSEAKDPLADRSDRSKGELIYSGYSGYFAGVKIWLIQPFASR